MKDKETLKSIKGLPLNYSSLESIKIGEKELITRLVSSDFHQTNSYLISFPFKPISKIFSNPKFK